MFEEIKFKDLNEDEVGLLRQRAQEHLKRTGEKFDVVYIIGRENRKYDCEKCGIDELGHCPYTFNYNQQTMVVVYPCGFMRDKEISMVPPITMLALIEDKPAHANSLLGRYIEIAEREAECGL